VEFINGHKKGYKTKLALPETPHLPSAQSFAKGQKIGHSTNITFAECQASGPRQTIDTWQTSCLPSAGTGALDKRVILLSARNSGKLPSAVSQPSSVNRLSSARRQHSANVPFCRGSQQKFIFFILDLVNFSTIYIQHLVLHVKVWCFLYLFAIFN
jgi:hypothetical protein